MNMEPNHDTQPPRPLNIGRGYLISHDGRVYPTGGGKPVKPLTLANARQEAAKAGGPHRMAREQNSVLVRKERILFALGGGRTAWGPLVDHVEYVRFPPPAQRGADGVAWCAGGPVVAAGDVNTGWYLLDDGERGRVLFHGPSEAARLFQPKQ
jgi:hypothetical protein